MKSAIISLSNEGARIAARLTAQWPPCAVFLHTGVTEMPEAARFERIVELTRQIFSLYESLIYVAPTGLVVRPGAVSATQDRRSGGRCGGRQRPLGCQSAERS